MKTARAVSRIRPRAPRPGRSNRLARIQRDVEHFDVQGGTRENFARLLADTGGQLELVKFKAHNAYIAARRAGASHEIAKSRAAARVRLAERRVEELIQEMRLDQQDIVAREFDHWLTKGLPLDEALLRTARNWGFGDGKADHKGRTRGRGIEDLKALLRRQGRDVSGSRLRATRAPRVASSVR